jgi:predicted RNA-binding Zn-ribbon protein involved in translation (DUF1610 family)
MPDVCYYFGCTVSFDCPICGRQSHEKRVYRAGRKDPRRVAAALAREGFDCQHCGAALVRRQKLAIEVLPAPEENLRLLGFALPRAA